MKTSLYEIDTRKDAAVFLFSGFLTEATRASRAIKRAEQLIPGREIRVRNVIVPRFNTCPVPNKMGLLTYVRA